MASIYRDTAIYRVLDGYILVHTGLFLVQDWVIPGPRLGYPGIRLAYPGSDWFYPGSDWFYPDQTGFTRIQTGFTRFDTGLPDLTPVLPDLTQVCPSWPNHAFSTFCQTGVIGHFSTIRL